MTDARPSVSSLLSRPASMRSLAFLVLVGCVVFGSGMKYMCNQCLDSFCFPMPRDGCPYGKVMDSCGCCALCGQGPNRSCDEMVKCGPGLTCTRPRYRWGSGVCKYNRWW
ncbi:single IB domain protein [Penaeus vannamei]|uniref:Single IB domain protein n=1 Tax=Penaeus vannamei TaxID=6689 RepID=A0A423TFV5_PENVA|nr:insulin-like growth factor-binding protein 7 [Penaeus vannamei]ROT75369.1 single IB domain protein [Penaeus vannamei]